MVAFPGELDMEFSILLDPDGGVTFPSLAGELLPIAEHLDPSFSRTSIAEAAPPARYLQTKRVSVSADPSLAALSQAALWTLHQRTRDAEPTPGVPDCSRLDLKIELAKRLYRACTLCPWNCGVDRMRDETGFCGLGRDAYYTNEFVHFGEEAAIRPSHTVFLTGCSLRCVYCLTGESVVRPT